VPERHCSDNPQAVCLYPGQCALGGNQANHNFGAHPALIYDYSGFPSESYAIEYPCLGLLVIDSGFFFHNMNVFFSSETDQARAMNEVFFLFSKRDRKNRSGTGTATAGKPQDRQNRIYFREEDISLVRGMRVCYVDWQRDDE
jgi:hypothetical protein